MPGLLKRRAEKTIIDTALKGLKNRVVSQVIRSARRERDTERTAGDKQPGGSGTDLIGDFQRWLLRAGARGMSRELTDQVRTALGKTPQPSGDVWETATHDPAPGEAPECAWCPLCRAARISGSPSPTRDTRVAAVGDALTTVVQDAVSVLEAALAATGRGGTPPMAVLPRPGRVPVVSARPARLTSRHGPVRRPRRRQRARRPRRARRARTTSPGGQGGPGGQGRAGPERPGGACRG